MGAPSTGMQTGEQASAEALLGAFKTIKAAERRKHASVLNYWLSIRGDKEFPPLHDLDPLELSDAGPNSALLELISGGHDAEIRHLGEALRGGHDWPERIMDAPSPSILACIAKKLPIVAISRDFLAFEDDFSDEGGDTRVWVTLLPLSAGGAWVDYVYALVSLESDSAKGSKTAEKPAKAQPEPESVAEVEEPAAEAEEIEEAPAEQTEDPVEAFEDPVDVVAEESATEELEDEAPAAKPQKAAPGFSKLFDSLAGLTGFHAQSVNVEPVLPEPEADEEVSQEFVEPESVEDAAEVEEAQVEEPVAQEPEPEQAQAEEEPIEQEPEPEPELDPEPEQVEAEAEEEPVAAAQAAEQAEQPSKEGEGPLQNKLTEVRAMADEARLAKLRANSALYEGLSAAYDFALDAEDAPEEYLRLVEAQGLKIQLRSPMKPVVKLAFDGLCDDATIKQLEAVLAWAFDQELPRGALAEKIEAAGGIARVIGGEAKAA